MTTPLDLQHAKLVTGRRLATDDQVARCLNDIKQGRERGGLLDVLIKRDFITAGQADMIKAAAASPPAGDDLELLDSPAHATGSPSPGTPFKVEIDDLLLPLDKVNAAPVPASPPARPARPPAPPVKSARPTPATPGKATPPAVRRPGPEPTPVAARRAEAPPGVRCMFCGVDIREGMPRQSCEHCGDFYHDDCMRKSDGCVRESCRRLAGMASGSGGRVLASSEYSLYHELRPYLLWGGTAILGVVGIVYLYLHISRDAQYYYDLGKASQGTAADGAGSRAWRAADLHRGMLAVQDDGTMGSIDKTVKLEEQSHYFRQATQKKPDFLEAWYELGVTYFKLKKNREALQAMERALSIKPDHTPAMLVLGGAAERLEDTKEAERWYRKALETRPDLLDANEMLAYLYESKIPGRKEEAAAQFRKVLEARPDDADIAGRLAQILIDQKKYVEALELIERVSQRVPGSVNLDLKRTTLYFAQGVYDKALQYAEQIAAADAQQTEARKIQAISLHKLGRDAEAYVVAKQLIFQVFDAEVSMLAGQLAIQAGEPDQGINFLRNAFTQNRSPEILDRVGNALLLLDRPEEAKTAFEELRSLNSAFPLVGFKIGLASAAMPDKVKADAAIKELLSRSPADPELRAIEARRMREAGDAAGCVSRLKEILAQSPQSYYARLQLGISLRESGNPLAALGELRAAYAAGQDPEALFELGLTYQTLKKESAAADAMRRYLEAVPFGVRHERARGIMETGGVVADKEVYSYALKTCADVVPRFATQALPYPYLWDYVTAGSHALNALTAVLAGNVERSMQSASSFHALFGRLATAPTANRRREDLEAELEQSMSDWITVLGEVSESLAIVIRRRDESKARADELDRLLEEIRQKVDAGMATDMRAAARAGGVGSLLSLLVSVLSDAQSTQEQLQRIQTLRRVQRDFSQNGLQSLCGEVYLSVKTADLLLSTLDRRKLYEEQQRAIQRRFEQRELKASAVLDQLRNGITALVEILHLIAADPSLRP